MDNKALIALALCGIIMYFFFSQMRPPSQEGTQDSVENTIEQDGVDQEVAVVEDVQTLKTEEIVQNDIEVQDNIVLQNDVIKAVWTNEGAALRSAILPGFKNPERTEILEVLKASKTESLPLSIELKSDNKGYQTKTRKYKVIEKGPGRVVFVTQLENGIQIKKEITLRSGNYYFDVAITLQNTTDSEIAASYSITAANGIYPEISKTASLASIVGIDVGHDKTKIVRTNVGKMPYENESVGITMAGATNKYFTAILEPSTNNRIASVTAKSFKSEDLLYNQLKTDDFVVELETKRVTIPSHDEKRHEYVFYLGPKEKEALNQCESLLAILEKDYGVMKPICKVLVAILNATYKVIPNYGVSILILTLLVKMVLFPLTRKSQMSMVRMQQFQPLINKLKEKHKGDKSKMGQEQMKLYKEHGVNPMSGCLPMLLQMPVFFALFRTLQASFEMRQAPFLSWIGDLSEPDRLFHLSFTMPILGDWFNVLPILMGAASFAQMKLTPKTAPANDPQANMQQKMMQIFPLVFPVILYSFPSGLVLYWTTSTVIGIGEQMLIRRSVKKLDVYYKGKRVIEGKAKVK